MRKQFANYVLTGFIFTLVTHAVFSQVSVTTDNTQPDPSAMLDVQSTTKGLLAPRMTNAQMNNIPNPANGLIVFCSDCSSTNIGALAMFSNGIWYIFTTGCQIPLSPEADIHDPQPTQITWNWYPVTGATGYKWNTTENYNSATDLGEATTKTESGLACTTAYARYIWAYSDCGVSTSTLLNESTSACGTSGVPCPSMPAVLYGGITYHTVLIGTQCWLRENLNIGTMISGTQEQTNNSLIEKYCYNNLESNCDIYGGMYQWNEIMQYVTTPGAQGICPPGWHIPTDPAWTTLITNLGGTVIAGGKMKTTGNVEDGTGLWRYPNTGASNESGFSSEGAGYRNNDGTFRVLGYSTYYWSSTENTSGNSWYRLMHYNYNGILRDNVGKIFGFSLRCYRDV
jgi:uncharacterized protein (TIGR02145 family)